MTRDDRFGDQNLVNAGDDRIAFPAAGKCSCAAMCRVEQPAPAQFLLNPVCLKARSCAHVVCIRIDLIVRCLVVADLHYSLPQFDWLLSAAAHFDLVIFAGDALDVASYVDFRAQIVVVTCINRRSSPTVRGSIGSAPLGGPP